MRIKDKIYTIRDVQVMLDSDLADLYRIPVKALNRAVKRNIERFPKSFCFQIREEEFKIVNSRIITLNSKDSLRLKNSTLNKNSNLRFQNGTSSSKHGGRRYLPYVFTEQGVSMLSAVLRSETAIKMSIQIINAFVTMKKFMSKNAEIFLRLDSVERKQLEYQAKTDKDFEKVFKALETEKPKQGIFYDGQIFDAYKFVSDLIKSAKKSVVLIDNYVDDSVFTLLSKKKKNIKVVIYTKNISKQLRLDLEKFNNQYEPIEIKRFDDSHDRFLIIDNIIYHFGASLKDLGKKWFAFSKIEIKNIELLRKIKQQKSYR